MKDLKTDPIEVRINRVEGQVKAVKKMYKEGKNCIEIVQQVQAARAALAKISGLILEGEARRCAETGDVAELSRVVEKTFKTI